MTPPFIGTPAIRCGRGLGGDITTSPSTAFFPGLTGLPADRGEALVLLELGGVCAMSPPMAACSALPPGDAGLLLALGDTFLAAGDTFLTAGDKFFAAATLALLASPCAFDPPPPIPPASIPFYPITGRYKVNKVQ
eukprot:Hpha_TRINITY_DN16823_c1_g2::TRINITY_DN16823_c1_g2_i1::g.150311::m.150311